MLSNIRRFGVLALVVLLLVTSLPAFAQIAPTPTPDPNANVVFPPPVYVLRGSAPIIGTANLPNMTNYFIEFRPLLSLPGDAAAPNSTPTATPVFFPAVLPSTAAVVDDVLGTWDTTLVPDGLYELRLTINTSGGTPVVILITPLRVENNLDPAIAALIGLGTPVAPTAAPVLPTQPPAATVAPTFDPTPRGTVTTASANVRTGDSTLYPAIASLPQDTVVELVGIASTGSGWYQVRLPSGQLGWMSPTVISVSGDVGRLPRVTPPPPPVTPTPIATATPVTTANLVAGIVVLNPNPPVCAQTFIVGFDVANLGSMPTAASGIVTLTNTRAADGSVQASTIGGFPILLPGQTFRVDMPLTVSTFYNEVHRITLVIDQANQIPETTLDDNVRTIEYTLQQGGCP
ncbi:MAG TPA: SH3 domain-containing protein [Candidatus Limnocylindrales bacterium]|nr:SH3 domain-containing protein [Candidatus Limnocylindrales bacterium]